MLEGNKLKFYLLSKEIPNSKKYNIYLEKLFLSYLPLVNEVLEEFPDLDNYTKDDVYQEGAIALIDAIKHFDLWEKWNFTDYGRIHIRNAVKAHIESENKAKTDVVSMNDHYIRTKKGKSRDILIRDLIDETEKAFSNGGRDR